MSLRLRVTLTMRTGMLSTNPARRISLAMVNTGSREPSTAGLQINDVTPSTGTTYSGTRIEQRLTEKVVSHNHQQTVASDVWTVNHNLGYRPSVTLLNAGGREMLAEVLHASANQVLVYFDSPISGSAICS